VLLRNRNSVFCFCERVNLFLALRRERGLLRLCRLGECGLKREEITEGHRKPTDKTFVINQYLVPRSRMHGSKFSSPVHLRSYGVVINQT